MDDADERRHTTLSLMRSGTTCWPSLTLSLSDEESSFLAQFLLLLLDAPSLFVFPFVSQ